MFLSVTDLDGGEDLDLVDERNIYENIGSRTILEFTKIPIGSSNHVVAVANLNGDENPEILGNGVWFKVTACCPISVEEGPFETNGYELWTAVDVNGDDLVDIVLYLRTELDPEGFSHAIRILLNDGSPLFPPTQGQETGFDLQLTGDLLRDLGFGDLDGHLDTDIVAVSNHVEWFENDGDPIPTFIQ